MQRLFWISTTLIVCLLLAIASVLPSQGHLIWNRTASAPQGLYLRTDGPLNPGRWVIVSSDAPAVKWIAEHGYIAPDWPIIKQVSALPGDEICRIGMNVSINGSAIARAQMQDSYGRDLPAWSGCRTLAEDEIFLLNDHPRSLDGRYFGPTKRRDILGTARLVYEPGK